MLGAIAEFTDVRVPSEGGTLSADIIRPVGPSPVPTLLTVLPYRKDLDLYWHGLMRWFAERGYACMMVDLSGTGRSDGVAPAKMSPEEARDSSAAMDWITQQPWSDGQIGMWGMSSGGFTTLRAAEVGHPALRAVIPMLSPLQPDADAFNHDGARVDLHQRILWSAQLLIQQWLPPAGSSVPRDYERWQKRMDHDPFFLDFVRHDAGDPEFARRAVDVSRIRVPTLCVGGWRDLYARSMVELFEQLEVPKRLIMGPWFHRGPRVGESFFEIALEWWDHWLRGGPAPSGSDVRCATLDGQWNAFSSWPPPQATTMRLVGAAGDTLGREPDAPAAPITHPVHSNATVGSLSGSWGMPSAGEVLPADQTDDDDRCLSLTGERLGADTVLAGAGTVEFELSATEPLPARIVARLCLVQEDGTSRFITSGTLRPTSSGRQVIRLRPTLCALPATGRLRVALGDADFPRLVPLPTLSSFTMSKLSVAVPVIDPSTLEQCDLFPSTGEPESGITAADSTPGWSIHRTAEHTDHDDVAWVRFAARGDYPLADGTRVGSASEVRATVSAMRPEEAEFVADLEGSLKHPSGESAVVTVSISTRQTRFDAHAVLTLDGDVARSQTWSEPLRPEGISA